MSPGYTFFQVLNPAFFFFFFFFFLLLYFIIIPCPGYCFHLHILFCTWCVVSQTNDTFLSFTDNLYCNAVK